MKACQKFLTSPKKDIYVPTSRLTLPSLKNYWAFIDHKMLDVSGKYMFLDLFNSNESIFFGNLIISFDAKLKPDL